jgi:hypothetical protein
MYTAVSEPVGRRIAAGDPDPRGVLMRFGSHRFWLCIAAAVAVIVIAVPAASAGVDKYNTVKIDSKVTLLVGCGGRHGQLRHHGLCYTDVFHGQVKSSKHACEVHRLVKVFETKTSHGGKRHKLVGKDRSNDRGKWTVVGGAGYSYAKVRRKEGTAFVCRGDRTPIYDNH